MGIPFAQGIQMLYDSHLNYVRSGLECFLRVANFAPSGDYLEVGLPYTPTGTDAAESGFVDFFILPPPATKPVPFHDIGLSGGKLMFGARKFWISDTWVAALIEKYPNIKGSYNVFRNWDGTASVVGIVYNNQLYSIEDIGRSEIAGRTISWVLTCNTHEEYLEPGSQETMQP